MSSAKRCTDCDEVKPRSEYYDGTGKCIPCYKVRIHDRYMRQRPEDRMRRLGGTPEEIRARKKARTFQRNYNITLDERDALLAAQGGVCAICKTSEPVGNRDWATDHDHACCPASGKSCGRCVRGVLCFRCNVLLGYAKDDIQTLLSAAAYLEGWGA